MRSTCLSVLVALMALVVLPAAPAATLTWNSATGGTWSSSSNWSPVDVPNSADDSVTFATVGDGFASTNDIAGLSISTFTVTEGTHLTDLGGNALTTATLSVEGFTTAKTGTLTVANGSLTVRTTFSAGYGSYADANILFDPATALLVGESTSSRATMRVAENTGASPTYGRATVTVGRVFNAYLSNLYVGHRNAGYSAGITYGKADLTAVTNDGVLDVSGNVEIGTDRNAAGDLRLSDSLDLRIGSSSTRGGYLYVSEGGHDANTPASRLTVGTGRFDAYVTQLYVGNGGETRGELAAGNASGGILDVSGNTIIGSGTTASGTVTVSDAIPVKIGDPVVPVELTIGKSTARSCSLLLGTNSFKAYLSKFDMTGARSGGSGYNTDHALYARDVSEGVLDVTGPFLVSAPTRCMPATHTVTLGSNFVTTIGRSGARVAMRIADGERPAVSTVRAGGSFTAYLSLLVVGNNSAAISQTGMNALLDLSAVTNGTLDVDGAVVIGSNAYMVGEIRLPAIPAAAQTLEVGTPFTSARGRLVMTGTVFAVSSSVKIDGPTAANRGFVTNTVSGAPGGLDLASGATLTVNQGAIGIAFQDPLKYHPVYWGLRWAGDHVAELTALQGAGKLFWDDSAIANPMVSEPVGIFVEGGVTYVGARMAQPQGILMTIF